MGWTPVSSVSRTRTPTRLVSRPDTVAEGWANVIERTSGGAVSAAGAARAGVAGSTANASKAAIGAARDVRMSGTVRTTGQPVRPVSAPRPKITYSGGRGSSLRESEYDPPDSDSMITGHWPQ